ncbi:MAG TPA: TIGR04211 family SH3 domain-containing protein, partial [Steroidobacteraceae bacterium]|nr:TIGR04211 family SH3 domain-containing protein [Steroidobacteraceae bacterium]
MQKWLLAALAMALAQPVYAETVFISDVLTVPLRSGPSLRHKILHAGLPSGTRLETLTEDPESGFTQVRLSDGTEGWVRSQYLTSDPIAKVQLAAANREIDNLRTQLESTRENL